MTAREKRLGEVIRRMAEAVLPQHAGESDLMTQPPDLMAPIPPVVADGQREAARQLMTWFGDQAVTKALEWAERVDRRYYQVADLIREIQHGS